MPHIKVLHCWKHLKRDVRFWVKKHAGKNDEVSVYVDNLTELLGCPDDFEEMLKELSQRWSEAFLDHFEKEL